MDGLLNSLFYFYTMKIKQLKRNLVLGILFFLPVVFLLFLYPSTHNYNPLDIVKDDVFELDNFTPDGNDSIVLENHLTVLGFFGKVPIKNLIAASNLKELVYDKFKGFKKFQIVIVLPEGTQSEAKQLRREISQYEELKYWHFVFGQAEAIHRVYNSFNSNNLLDNNLSSDYVFIVDKDLSQRGRIDDRTDGELQKEAPIYDLNAYNCIEVAEIKNKMSEDLRILFTEYRQKRKGNFDSSSRRDKNLKEEAN